MSRLIAITAALFADNWVYLFFKINPVATIIRFEISKTNNKVIKSYSVEKKTPLLLQGKNKGADTFTAKKRAGNINRYMLFTFVIKIVSLINIFRASAKN
jgi:hypothetical protein